jgi:alkylated DNA repair protein (DNA oxidative demethylase)
VKPNREDSGHQAVARCRVPAADRASVGRGNTSRRTVRHLGLRYDYSSRALRKGEPIPEELVPIMHQAAEFAALCEGELVEAIVNRYPLGGSVGWHHDAPVYDVIVGVSLGAACTIQFRTEEAK